MAGEMRDEPAHGPTVAYRCPECGGVVRTTVSGECACRALQCDISRFDCRSARKPTRVSLGPCIDDLVHDVAFWRDRWLVVREPSLLRNWTVWGEPTQGAFVRLIPKGQEGLVRFRGRFADGFDLHVALRAHASEEPSARWGDEDLVRFLGASGAGANHRFADRAEAADELDARWANDVLQALQPAARSDVPFATRLAFGATTVAREISDLLSVVKSIS